MQRIQELLGGKTRFAVIEALAEARQPVTAYQIAVAKGLDPAATYRCLAEISELGIAKSFMKGRKQTSYALSANATGKAAAKFLQSLKQKIAEQQVADLEVWISPEMKARRMSKVIRPGRVVAGNMLPAFARERRRAAEKKDDIVAIVADLFSKRIRGELAALIESSQIAFKELFEQKDDRTFVLKE